MIGMTKLRALTAGLLLSTFSVGYAAIEADRLIDWSGDAQVSFEVQIEAESTKPEFSFAIIVTPAVEADSVEIRLNGSGTGTAPLINNGKLIFKAEQAFLNIGGENTISFVDEDGNDVPVTSIEMFQLQDTTQDVHFHKFLGKSASTRRAQPTLHSSQNNYDVTHYLVEIEPAMSSRALTGKVTMEAKSLVDGLATVALDFDDASTDSSSGTLLTISSVEMVPAVVGMTYSYDAANKWILVNIPLADRPDTDESFTIKVEYSGTPTTVASSFSTAPFGRVTQPTNGKSVVYTFGEPYGARGWFPCKDVVSDKAMVDVKITVPDPNIAVSHGNLVSTTALSGSRTEYHWSHGYPISTYLIAFAATEYAYAEDDYTALDNVTTMPVGHYVYLNSTSELAAVPVTIDVIEKFAGMFGEYPFLDEKYVTMTWGAGFGMEHTTCTSINNGNLVSVSPAGQSRRNIHEIAHQWFGDLVTPTSFDHIWLNEGWATYCEALYFEAIGDFDDYKNYVQSTWMNVTNNQTLPLVHSEADDFENALVYRKGGIVLHMLRHVVGDTAFFQGTRDYLDASALGSVDSEDFKEALEAASGKDLDNFFNDWVYGPGRPSYEWTWSQLGEELDIFVRQTGSNFFEMPIDFVVTGSTGTQTFVFDNTAQNQTQSFDISGLGKITSVSFDPDRWIYRATTTTSAPPVPTLLSVINDFGSVTVTWLSGGGTTAGFEVWSESEFSPLTKLADSSTLGAGATSFQESGILVPTTYYVRAVNSVGAPSATSDVYRTSLLPVSGRRTWDRPKVLIVDGYDRWDTQARGTNHPWAEVHGKALDSAFKNYDTCANEQVISGAVLLTDYDGVVWVLGEESTGDRTFNATEQTLVMAYLESGGKLFVSGAEIGWDIGRAASANYSPAFYNGYLKANYVADQWGGAYSVSRSAGNSMLPMTMNIAGSGDGIYFAQWLDVISPVDEVDNSRDSQAAYEYATSNVAAVMYKGSFGSSVNQGGVVYLGFPFETIISESDRNQLMQSVMDYLEIISTNGLGQEWMIF